MAVKCPAVGKKVGVGSSRERSWQLSQFSRDSPSFSSNLPISPLGHQIFREIRTVAFFQEFFIKFDIFQMSERKVKQEVNEVPLFELFLIVKRKTEESNLLAFNECRIWSEINRLNCTVNGRKLARF